MAGAVRHSLASGTSQAGNFLKTFVHLGFNEDLAGRIVWDGIFPFIAARQTPLNFRFAAPLADRFHVVEHGQIVETIEAHDLEARMPVLTELLGV